MSSENTYLPEFNQVYQITENRWQKQTTFDENLSQLSLFSATDFQSQQQLIGRMASNCEQPLLIKVSGSQQQCCWHVFAQPETLKLWVEKNILDSVFDYVLWPAQNRQAPRLLLFDMDSTFIEIEVIDELARLHGVADKVTDVTEKAMRGEMDFAQSLIARVACLQGLGDNAIHQLKANLPLSPGVSQLVKVAQENNCRVAIVSGGFMPFVEQLKQQEKLYAVKANLLEIEKKQLTGKVLGNIVDAQAKAEFLVELCEQLNILPEQAMAIGDGANDLKMMAKAGFNLAYRAKPKVQQAASGRMNQTHLNWLALAFNWK
ncbi:phosphoserine phosphatase SerB [Aliikangiella maris]|uniref:Phosphoserine phosphatase n=2 Tax=Aliikangiella maris TaxID=3162458 RepID=A0ABV2BXG4_9GAMM